MSFDVLLAVEEFRVVQGILLKDKLTHLEGGSAPSADDLLGEVSRMDEQARDQQSRVNAELLQLLANSNSMKQNIQDKLGSERTPFNDFLNRLEGLTAKLEYELNGLASKVDDVEAGVADYEDQVKALQSRAQHLEIVNRGEASWLRQAVHFITGR